MKQEQRRIRVMQLDRIMANFAEARKHSVPGEGWIYAIREALGMSLKQMGNRLGLTPQGAKDIERREKDGSLTLQRLREVAARLDMQLIYALIPKDQSLEMMIEKRAYELAREIVLKTSQTMHLENQGLDEEKIRQAIENRAKKIKDELPKNLWN